MSIRIGRRNQQYGLNQFCRFVLAESVTRDDLRAMFSKIGCVGGALVITDKPTGKSRGFGFVEMVEVEDAINAAVYFSGTELECCQDSHRSIPPR